MCVFRIEINNAVLADMSKRIWTSEVISLSMLVVNVIQEWDHIFAS
jgi:hypothetical protein